MSKRRYVIAALAALGLVAAACSSSDKGSSSTEATTGVTAGDTSAATTGGSAAGATDTVEATQGQDLTFYMITHGDDGPFWSVVQKGAEQAGKDLGVTVKYQGANNDAEAQSQMIEAAISDGPQGIAISLADPAGSRPRRRPWSTPRSRCTRSTPAQPLQGARRGHPHRPGRDRRR